jgi:hypothetical protein
LSGVVVLLVFVGVEPGEEVVEVGGGEFPLERAGSLVVAGREGGQAFDHEVEVGEVVRREHLSLDDGEVDLD